MRVTQVMNGMVLNTNRFVNCAAGLSMRDKIEEIKKLLSELENEYRPDVSKETMRIFSGLELPDIVRDIVDLLVPNLKPYEAAFYWYLFRHSILEAENPLLRVSTHGLQSGVLRSSRDSEKVSEAHVRETLRALEQFGAIRKEADANRDGTLYRILLPEEISICQTMRAEREKETPSHSVQEMEADYYNVRENRLKVYERDGYKCQYCGKQMTRFTATLDHIHAVTHGGDNSMGNLVTACRECNSKKNSRLLGDFIADENPTG
jgi:HNH endonuclease